MITCGIDAGSRTIKAVLLDTDRGRVLASGLCDQGVRQAELAEKLVRRVLRQAGLRADRVDRTVATGYGRNSLVADRAVTEITCHARGVRHLLPRARSVIDIGGQDSKVIRLDRGGHVQDFVMNNRCAAGTGRFLELVAGRLELALPALGKAAARARRPTAISSMCAVFAETEIVGLLAAGEKPANIAAGVQAAIASRILAMAGKDLPEPVAFTGGVALVGGMREALQKALRCRILIPPDPQFAGALGAALIAGE
jgi:(R)-2-hydroxyacyl-CoA dehydratese activating ATPase